MYLSRFIIDPARRGARKLIASPQAMHAAIRGAFADPADYERADARTLWRLDTATVGTLHLYIVSPGQPDLTHMVAQAGRGTAEAWQTRAYGGLLASLQPGQQWAFRLTANPTHSGRKTADSKETQRFGHLRPEQQTQWLIDRSARCGFAVATQQNNEPNVGLHHRQTQTFRRGAGSVTLTTVTYDGLLDITDADAFRQTLSLGIGHGKAYGCGLLTIAPTR
ncbi:type I-E CRISPR-associated protein Cas6/Cse3/CasE [Dactylosporangium sp. NPDC049742]|uniref:type I-E CRISPR-associated protein Cas6/Cse3/CasE n=1 Tax=Dactylosporangium sp. NPDC049742 TaxID=3154737 RepID=UPI003422E227